MMLFKLSLKNIRKSFKDYTVYFLTLILGVAIFYVFNAIDSQTAMLALTESSKDIVKLLVELLSGVSVLVALILGFLIVYASNFLIKRRKKEFGIYMTLGMGKREISRILLGETLTIGLVSLVVGLVVGIFGSQFMSILVAKMFEADMTGYTFVFSDSAMWKTIIYFGIMYLIVMMFNVVSISRYKLIDLFQASHKNEQGKLKSSFLSVILFVAACMILGYAYNQVAFHTSELNQRQVMQIIALGCVGTFLVFWSMSGFLLKLMQRIKGFYHRGLNAFVLRQVNSNINTAVFSMTIICLLFFVTITVLSAGLSMNHSLKKELERNCPVDVNIEKEMDVEGEKTDIEIADSRLTIEEVLTRAGFDFSMLSEYLEITIYNNPDITYEQSLGSKKEEIMEQFPVVRWGTRESIISNSDYNKMAALYGMPTYQVKEGNYLVVCDYTPMINVRNAALQEDVQLTIGNTVLHQQENECVDGFIRMEVQNMNDGLLVVPDSVIEQYAGTKLQRGYAVFAANYAAQTKEEKQKTEERFAEFTDYDGVLDESYEGFLLPVTKIEMYEAATGLSAIVIFVALYLGIVFLIAGAALLALKELSESATNKERYTILDKLGVEEKQKHKALLWQMGIFFGMPMLLAMIHSVFGILFTSNVLRMYSTEDMKASLLFTGGFLIIVYGGYFLATYAGSRRIIDEK